MIRNAYKANNLEECFEYLEQGYKIISGGTDVVVQLQEGHLQEVDLLDISSVEELQRIIEFEDKISIGAGMTFTDILSFEELFPYNLHGFIESIESIGSPQIRNAGTIGGNLCNGSPAADSIPPLIVLDAILVIASKDGEREMRIKDFFIGKGKVALKKNEILKSIVFTIPEEEKELNFFKFNLRNALSITLGSIATLMKVEEGKITDINIASGGFSAYCQKEEDMEWLFVGKTLEEARKLIPEANEIVQKRIEQFDDEFKTMKLVTLSGALKTILKG